MLPQSFVIPGMKALNSRSSTHRMRISIESLAKGAGTLRQRPCIQDTSWAGLKSSFLSVSSMRIESIKFKFLPLTSHESFVAEQVAFCKSGSTMTDLGKLPHSLAWPDVLCWIRYSKELMTLGKSDWEKLIGFFVRNSLCEKSAIKGLFVELHPIVSH